MESAHGRGPEGNTVMTVILFNSPERSIQLPDDTMLRHVPTSPQPKLFPPPVHSSITLLANTKFSKPHPHSKFQFTLLKNLLSLYKF